ncbi:unnamed protein product [Colias eurytheme]|nr:unnamed protein product [Colias eurytheme]
MLRLKPIKFNFYSLQVEGNGRAAHGEKSRRRIANKPPLLSLKLSADSGRIATSAVMPSTHNKIKRDDAIEGRASSAERRAPLRTALLDFT